ncbi:MAG: PEP-CTERM sorting domain-containing protein [Desulfobacula sp.]|nr:PEP-CTERM sorting domain-containing protein [Desulfobacula sp.]
MKRKIFLILAAVFLYCTTLQAATIVDTGPGTTGLRDFGTAQWLSSRFTLDQDYFITDIAGWVVSEDRAGQRFSISIYHNDNGETPGTHIYTNGAVISGTDYASWEGYHISYQNGLELLSGDYWVNFEKRTANVDDYDGFMPYNSANPLVHGAVITAPLTLWSEFDDLKLGIRITGDLVNPVPEPATLFLFGSGMIGLAGINRKKYL